MYSSSYENAYSIANYMEYNGDPNTHKEIIELVKWAGDHNLICKSLAKFIIDKSWEDLKSLKNGDKVNINYDSMRLL